MAPFAYPIITDESQGKSDFIQPRRLVGRMVDISLVPGERPISAGPREGQIRCRFVLKFQNISELVMEDDTTPERSEYTLNWDYSEWIVRPGQEKAQGRPGIPERRGTWLQFINKHLLELGVNLNDPVIVDRITRKLWTCELKSWPRGYQVQDRDPDTNEVLWWGEDADGNPVPTTEKPSEDADRVMVDSMFSAVVPVEIEGLEFNPQEAYDRAKELREEFTNDDEFIAAAIDDPAIQEVPSLRRKIQRGTYDPTKPKG